MKRLFTFGCSYTNWCWPTWADYIGINFQEYYNLADSGCDNKNILFNVLQADKTHKFTKDDTIIVMFTSFNRCSYFKNYELYNVGDVVKAQDNHPMTNKYPYEAGIYDSWISANSIKTIFDTKDLNYQFIQAMPYDFMWKNHKVLNTRTDIKYSTLVKDYNESLYVKISLDEWARKKYDFDSEQVVWQDNGMNDGHPTMKMHLDFVKAFFPQYYTEKATDFYDLNVKHFTDDSQGKQGKKFELIKKQI